MFSLTVPIPVCYNFVPLLGHNEVAFNTTTPKVSGSSKAAVAFILLCSMMLLLFCPAPLPVVITAERWDTNINSLL